MLKFGRCLLANPKLLLLDEPTEGLAPTIVKQLLGTLDALRKTGIPMLLCEQNARIALAVSDDAYLLDKGVIRYGGPAADLLQRSELHEHLGLGPGMYGVILGMMGIGGVSSGMLLPLVRGRISRGNTVIGCTLFSCAGVALLGVSRHWLPAARSSIVVGYAL